MRQAPSPSLTNTPRLPGDERRSAIVDSVLSLSATTSPALISTSDIARAVGLSQGAIFKHFPRKEDIWLAVAESIASRLLVVIEAAANRAVEPLPGLRAIFLAHVDFVIAHPGAPRFIFHELQQAAETPVKACLRRLMGRYRQQLLDLLAIAERQGLLVEGIDASAAALSFIGSIQGLVMQSMLAGSGSVIAVQAPAILAIFERGIRRAA